jgi:ferredoxin/flavodoxin---NADP+ reductase
VDVIVDGKELEQALAVADANMDPTSERNVKVLREYAERPPRGEPRRIVLRFLLSPVELLGDHERGVSGVRLVRNELVAGTDGSLRAQASEEQERIAAGFVLRAVGYRGRPLPGVPFDEQRGVIRNEGGRVCDPQAGAVCPGEFVVGWIKRGPTGVIGTNKKDAQETVDAILEDLARGALPTPPSPEAQAIEELLRQRRPELVSYEGWSEIDRHERGLGEPHGRPRVKLTRIEEMLQVAAAEQGSVSI